MGTEVLRPQDCFVERIRISPSPETVFPRRRSFYNQLNNTSCGRQAYNHPKPTTTTARKPAVRSPSEPPKPKKKQTNSDPPCPISKRSSSEDLKHYSSKNFFSGQVQILRRGGSLDSKAETSSSLKKKKKNEMIISGTERLGPDPEMMSKQVRAMDSSRPPSPISNNNSSSSSSSGGGGGSSNSSSSSNNNKQFLSPVAGGLYAGSAFSVSPSPDSLPLPSFSKKKQVSKIVDDSATRDLRRMLRLD